MRAVKLPLAVLDWIMRCAPSRALSALFVSLIAAVTLHGCASTQQIASTDSSALVMAPASVQNFAMSSARFWMHAPAKRA